MWKFYLCLAVALICLVEKSEQEYFAPEDCKKGPQEPGAQCNAYFPVWSWVDTEETCLERIYGGCRKTANNFPTREDCLRVAGPICKRLHFTKADCNKGTENEEGPHCLASIQVWHWNNAIQRCEKAIYGGCNASRNNFRDEAECLQVAKPVCTASSY